MKIFRMKNNRYSISVLILFVASLNLISCGKNYTPEQKEYIKKVEKYRADKNEEMKTADYSPFNMTQWLCFIL